MNEEQLKELQEYNLEYLEAQESEEIFGGDYTSAVELKYAKKEIERLNKELTLQKLKLEEMRRELTEQDKYIEKLKIEYDKELAFERQIKREVRDYVSEIIVDEIYTKCILEILDKNRK